MKRRTMTNRIELFIPSALSYQRGFHVFRSMPDARLSWVHSRWIEETAFDNPVGFPDEVRFLEPVASANDALDARRARVFV